MENILTTDNLDDPKLSDHKPCIGTNNQIKIATYNIEQC